MSEYLECEGCGFVLQAEISGAGRPLDRPDCPGCGGREFKPPE